MELGQACLKWVRSQGSTNPTALTYGEIYNNLIEEFNDVMLVSKIIGMEEYPQRQKNKLDRWVKRLEND